jgi:hypothetical protein
LARAIKEHAVTAKAHAAQAAALTRDAEEGSADSQCAINLQQCSDEILGANDGCFSVRMVRMVQTP